MRRNQSALLGLAGAALALAGAGYATRASSQDSAGWPATSSVPEIASARSGIGAHLAWGDVDGDRLPDAVAVRADGGLSLFRNAGDGTLSEATEQSGLADVTGVRVALLEDLDGDGLADLFLGGAAGSRLLVSMGAGFAEITEGSGLAGLADVRAARTLDYDADGRPDLAVTTPHAELLFHNTGSGRFEPVDLLSLAVESAVTVVSPPPVGPPSAEEPSAEEPPTSRREGASAGGGQKAGRGFTATPAGRPSGGNASASPWCPPTIADSAFPGNCIPASTVPTLGALLPLGPELFVAPWGSVGIGTTSPAYRLDVVGNARITGSSTWIPLTVLGGDHGNSFEVYDGDDVPGVDNVIAQFRGGSTLGAMVRYTDTDGLFYDVGMKASGDYAIEYLDIPRLTVQPSGNVGIGTSAPTELLEVAGTASVHVLKITGGADIVEGFDSTEELEPGTVVVIDPENPGGLVASSAGYDRKVAGVVSGANGVKPGLELGQDGLLDGEVPVAMSGRVYVKCSTENGAIRPGDRLTTASLAGHAMKATDRERCDGAVLGKAMSSLDEETGLVLVLVNLQ